MPINELLAYITFVIVFAIVPGPNMVLYLTYTFEYGRKAGWATAAGIASAFVIHISAVVFGLTAILMAMPHSLDILRYFGIAYLFYLAFKNLRTINLDLKEETKTQLPLKRFYTRGFIYNLINPGSMVLYFLLIPQFIHPLRGHLLTQNILLGGLQMVFSFLTNCIIIFFAGFASRQFFTNVRYQRWLRYGMSAMIIVFAVKLLFTKFV